MIEQNPPFTKFISERRPVDLKLPPIPAYVAYRNLCCERERTQIANQVRTMAQTLQSDISAACVMRLCDATHLAVVARLYRILGDSIDAMPFRELPHLRSIYDSSSYYRRCASKGSVPAQKSWAYEYVLTGKKGGPGRLFLEKPDGSVIPISLRSSPFLDLDYVTCIRPTIENSIAANSTRRDPFASMSWGVLFKLVNSGLQQIEKQEAPIIIEIQAETTWTFDDFRKRCERYSRDKGNAPQPQSSLEAAMTANPGELADNIARHMNDGLAPIKYWGNHTQRILGDELQDAFARIACWPDSTDPREIERWARQFVVNAVINELIAGDLDLKTRISGTIDDILSEGGFLWVPNLARGSMPLTGRELAFKLGSELLIKEREWFALTVEKIIRRDYSFLA